MPERSASAYQALFESEPPSRWQMARMHVAGPWSRRRAWGIVLAGLARTPGLRAHVLYTTPIKDHPMWELTRAARRPPRASVGWRTCQHCQAKQACPAHEAEAAAYWAAVAAGQAEEGSNA